ncbi:MAG TPA: adenosylmethionine decarboxylase [Casimicrobiaceae bacterium]|nr:adenosylmethionine decarboxylase [Casimicrobiaceae bacterium]
MDGIHLLGEWYGCPADSPYMTDRDALRTACLAAVEHAGLTIVGDHFHQFEPQGVTGAVILAESHLAIHTWPEMESVTIDVYVCNFTTDNNAKAHALFRTLKAKFKPTRAHFQAIRRGGVNEGDEDEPDPITHVEVRAEPAFATHG